MTIKEFEALDITAQANAVWDGKFINSHIVDDVFVQLYQLDGFQVKVFYNPTKNQINGLMIVSNE
jgi:hypothetical protein